MPTENDPNRAQNETPVTGGGRPAEEVAPTEPVTEPGVPGQSDLGDVFAEATAGEEHRPETVDRESPLPDEAALSAQIDNSAGPAEELLAVNTENPLSEEMNREIERAMKEMDRIADASSGGSQQQGKAKLRGPRRVESGREHRTGAVVSVGPTDIFIEFGPKELGVIDRSQFSAEETPAVGGQLEVVIDRYDANENLYICQKPGSVQKADWELLEPGQVVEAKVAGVNKGGLEMEVAGHPAFMPASQVTIGRIEDLSVFVGEKLTCVVQRVDRRGKGNIVLSRRDILQQERAEAATKLRETLQEGQTIDGIVRKIMPFGAFVDLGGVDGLVHLADLSHDRVGHGEKNVARHVSEGQKVRVQILSVDWDENRISLGMKQLEADPFAQAASEVTDGAEVTGKVTRIADFGAFVEVAPGVEGLVHISELDHRRVGKVSDVVREGEVIQVKVLSVDPKSRKISLSVKALKPAPEDPRRKQMEQRVEEIQKETPALRRMREKAKQHASQKKSKGSGGLGGMDYLGGGLGDLKL